MTNPYDPTDGGLGEEADFDPDDVSPEEASRLRRKLEGLLPELIKRTVSSGVGAAGATEEVVRTFVREMRLPREAVGYILQQVDSTKTELVAVAARELRAFLESANLGDEIAKILTTLSFEIRTEVRFIPNDEAFRPDVRSRVAVKNARSGEKLVDEEPPEEVDEAIRGAAAEIASRLLRRRRRGTGAPGEGADAEGDAGDESGDDTEEVGDTGPTRQSRDRRADSADRKKSGRRRQGGRETPDDDAEGTSGAE